MSVLSDITIEALCTGSYYYDHVIERIDHGRGNATVKIDRSRSIDNNGKPMIEPFIASSIKLNDQGEGIASYGVSSYGYDIRAAPEFKIFSHTPKDGILDYKKMDNSLFEYVEADEVIIPPNGFILARSVEYIRIPRNVIGICLGKSTIARVGINCLVTPLEPEWEGYITLEFSNTTSIPNRFYANEGVLQLLFITGDQPCKTSYADRKGKYQSQTPEIILPRV